MKKILLPLAALMLWSCSEEIDAPPLGKSEPQSEAVGSLSPYDQAAIAISQKAIGSISGTAASRSAAPLLTLKETLRYPAASRGADEEQPVTIYNFNEGGYSVVKNIGGYPELLVYSDKGRFDPADEIPQMLLTMAMDFQDSIPTPKYSVEPVFVGPTRWHYDHICNAKRIHEFEAKVPKLLKTEWNNGVPYNFSMIVDGQSGVMNTGCGPIAVAQILAYHKHPQYIDGQECRWDVYTANPRVETYDDYAYELAGIINSIAAGCKVTGVYDRDNMITGVKCKISDVSNYLQSLGFKNRLNRGLSVSKINFDLIARCPVIMLGFTNDQNPEKDAGHVFIIDGVEEENYRDEYYNTETKEYCETIYTHKIDYHVNWGLVEYEDAYVSSSLMGGFNKNIVVIDKITTKEPTINL